MYTNFKIIIAVAVCGVLTVSCDERPPRSERHVDVIVGLLDQSGSADEASRRCDEFMHRLGAFTETRGVRELHVLGLATGDVAHVEPLVAVGWARFERASRDPLGTERDDGDTKRGAFLDQLRTSCTSSMTTVARTSPLILGVSRAAGALGARCAEVERTGSHCRGRLFIHFDGRETTDACVAAHIEAEIKGTKRKPACELTPIALPPSVPTTVCGLAQSGETESLKEAAAVERVWRQLLPGAEFQPFCPLTPSTEAQP